MENNNKLTEKKIRMKVFRERSKIDENNTCQFCGVKEVSNRYKNIVCCSSCSSTIGEYWVDEQNFKLETQETIGSSSSVNESKNKEQVSQKFINEIEE